MRELMNLFIINIWNNDPDYVLDRIPDKIKEEIIINYEEGD